MTKILTISLFNSLTDLDFERKKVYFVDIFRLLADPDPGGQNVADPTHCLTLSKANIYIIIFPCFKHHYRWYHVRLCIIIGATTSAQYVN